MNNFVLQERHGATLLVTLNRPERRNAFDLEVRAGIAEAVWEARNNPEIRAVVFIGAGNVFSAGGDLKSLQSTPRSPIESRTRIRNLHPWFRELVNLEKPVIAAVDGHAYGGGFNLALACDFVLATPRAKFCAVFGRIGLVPDLGGFYLLPRIVGLQRAKDIVFSARELSAQEALDLGIAFQLVAPEDLLSTALTMAERYHDASTEALGMAKNVLNRSFNLDQDTLAELESYTQALAMSTDYHHDAIDRFLAKKPLRFRS